MSDARLPLRHSIWPGSVESGGSDQIVLLLHGFMENEESMQRLAACLKHGLRVVSVRAPIQVGEHAYGWARARFTPDGPEEDEQEFENSRRTLVSFVDELLSASRSESSPVYLMGFSQGASLCLSLAMTEGERFSGVAAVSGKLLRRYSSPAGSLSATRLPPIFMAHGTHDGVVPIERAREDARSLRELADALTYREYETGHELGEATLQDVAAWLKAERSLNPGFSS